MARPWARPKAGARPGLGLRASNGLMCVRGKVLKENSERTIAAPGGTRTYNLLL